MQAFLHDMHWVLPLRQAWLTPIFVVFSALGYLTGQALVLCLGYWLWRKDTFARVGAIAAITGVLNSFFKYVFEDPRPPIGLRLETTQLGYGFPSGHGQLAVAIWMLIAWELKKPWAWALCVVLMIGQCFSRLYLAVHDVEDILGGSLLGLITLLAFQALRSERLKAWHALAPQWQLLAFAVVLGMVTLAAPALARRGVLQNGFFGLAYWGGVLWERRILRVEPPADWVRRALAAAVGLAGLGLLWFLGEGILLRVGLEKALAKGVVMTAAGAWIALGAPVLFTKLRLSGKAAREAIATP